MDRINLSGIWELTRPKTGERFPIRIPGDNVAALVQAKAMPDPYWGTNEIDCLWIAQENWILSRKIELTESIAKSRLVELRFEMVDTIADFFWNGKLIGSTRSMFVPVRLAVTDFVKKGENELSIHFRSAENEAKELAKSLDYPVPHSQFPIQSQHRNLVRKAQFQSGWDWGPCLMTSGLYGEVALLADTRALLRQASLTVKKSSENIWAVHIRCEIEGATPHKTKVVARFENSIGSGVEYSKQTSIIPGTNEVDIEFTVENPELWFPNGYGKQHLYEVEITLGKQKIVKGIGFRTLEWEVKDDEFGRSLVCVVNGVRIFCKGANWIPVDALPSRWVEDSIERRLEDAKDAHMNMVRVWGGGVYESDFFYKTCDRLGLLVWQDFMFACSTYPATEWFLKQVKDEVSHQVRRLGGHPCLALWCGNNENLGALNWYEESRKDPKRYLVDYDRLNEGTIGKTVREIDGPGRWWPSSPSAGVDDYSDGWHVQGKGDMHFWSVWHEGKGFDAYLDVIPRFCSEFGFQSFPWPSDIATYAAEDQRNLTSPVMEHHQRSGQGNKMILETFARYFRIPDGFDNALYLSQVQQAIAIKTASEYWRSQRPRCMGILYWQLNDLWPVASWASITHSGKWKLLHYAAKDFFRPIHVLAFQRKQEALRVFLINDTLEKVSGTLHLDWYDFEGRKLHSEQTAQTVAAETASAICSFEPGRIPEATNSFLELTFTNGDRSFRNTFFLTEPKKASLKDPEVVVSIEESDGNLDVVLTASRPAFWVTLDTPWIGRFSENGVTLLAGEKKSFRWLGKKVSKKTFARGLRIYNLFSSSNTR